MPSVFILALYFSIITVFGEARAGTELAAASAVPPPPGAACVGLPQVSPALVLGLEHLQSWQFSEGIRALLASHQGSPLSSALLYQI